MAPKELTKRKAPTRRPTPESVGLLPTADGVPGWLPTWLLASGLIVIYDALYCLLRPHSMAGGALEAAFAPYKLYSAADQLYGTKGYEGNDGFCGAQASVQKLITAHMCLGGSAQLSRMAPFLQCNPPPTWML